MRLLTACCVLIASVASAQDASIGPGRLEIGGFPMGGTFFGGGDGNTEVDFNVYSAGANVTYYVARHVALEGEFGIGFGLAQDVFFNRTEVFHAQMPNVWTSFGNVVLFPTGAAAGRQLLPYVTGGFGAVLLQSRQPTKPFGYDEDRIGFATFTAETIGSGVKMFRGSAAPEWGFRADYRYLIVNSNSDAPPFFAKTKRRGGHRIYFGILFTAKR